MRTNLLGLAVALVLVSLAGCESTTIVHQPGEPDNVSDDTPAPAEVDSGAVMNKDAGPVDDDAGPTAAPSDDEPQPIPQVPFNGGKVMGQVSLVTITFDSDTFRTKLEAFANTVGTSAWWDTVRAGYCDNKGTCVGHATPHPTKPTVHLPTSSLATSYTDAVAGGTIGTLIDSGIKKGTFPAPTPDTLYLLYFPASVTITAGDPATGAITSCKEFDGYHTMMTSSGVTFPYAIIARCPSGSGSQVDLDAVTLTSSHELAEAASDPFYDTNGNTGFMSRGEDAWDFPGGGGEIGDRCFLPDANTKVGVYNVQRIFSNVAAKAGHDPCVPAPSPATTPYFNITPYGVHGDMIKMAVGQTITFPVHAMADGAIPSGLSWGAKEFTNLYGRGNDVLDVSVSHGTIAIGGTATVTVTLKSALTGDYALLFLTSQRIDASKGPTHYWPIVIYTN